MKRTKMKKLIPFADTEFTKKISVETALSQDSPQLVIIEFKITDPHQIIKWPSSLSPIERKDELWKTTCLETFISLGKKNDDPYVEINCSPNGNWNAYSFARYREGMEPNQEISVHLRSNRTDTSSLQKPHFFVEVHSLSPFTIQSANCTMVTEFTNGEKAYWAAQHPSLNADFHNKEFWYPF